MEEDNAVKGELQLSATQTTQDDHRVKVRIVFVDEDGKKFEGTFHKFKSDLKFIGLE